MNELPLRDIHLPDPISWWPLALGWWLVLALVVFFIAFTCWWLNKRLKPTLKKEALQALDAIEASLHETDDPIHCLAELSVFLRRVILSQKKYPPGSVALTGTAWLELLDQSLDTPEFSQGLGVILLTGPYQASAEKQNVFELLQLCKKWVKNV